jgi:hypothetical protein
MSIANNAYPDRMLGKPLEYWIEMSIRIEKLSFDKATALEDLVLTKVRLERELREMKNNFNQVAEIVNKLKGEQL